jgi:hypothetical protein
MLGGWLAVVDAPQNLSRQGGGGVGISVAGPQIPSKGHLPKAPHPNLINASQ